MPIKTLIVDDTVTYRKILSDVCGSFPDVELLGSAPSGALALKKMAQTVPNLVLLDVHMPDMNGVETLRHIRRDFPSVFVVMISGISDRSADDTIEALELGAVDFIAKPVGNDMAVNLAKLKSNLQSVLRLIQLKMATQAMGLASGFVAAAPAIALKNTCLIPAKGPSRAGALPRSFSVVAIGVSTGGPEALGKILPLLPADLSVPVVLVQHMPASFTKSLAEHIDKKSKLRIVEASDGETIVAGKIYIAPGGRHMVLRNNVGSIQVGLNDEPPENSCRPSVDVLFRSVASVYGDKGVLSVILTGMGNDGCSGVRALKRHSCYSITQSATTCVVYGMPRAVDEAGLCDCSLDLMDIPGQIDSLVKGKGAV